MNLPPAVSSALRHAFTALASLGTFLSVHGWISPSDAAGVNAAGVSLGDALAVVAAAVVARLLIWIGGKFAGGDVSLFTLGASMCIGTLAVGGLSACSADQLAAARAIPIRIGIQGPDASVSYSSKSGLAVEAVIRAEK